MSQDAYVVYSEAAARVESGWTQGEFSDSEGVCLIGSIRESISNYCYETPQVIVDEIGYKLRFKPWYLCIRTLNLFSIGDKENAIMVWNDAPWRRQASVVKVLRHLAADHRPPRVSQDVQLRRLQQQVQTLESEKAVMSARIARLEAENAHLWRRLLSQRDLTSDREVLESLDTELDSIYTKIETMS